ncbi:MAG: hypothetical protein IJD13_09220 [Oscillospiraceae bacterium]|nr:hypothetical protein [Oscillospiraceae bacterium]
MEMILASHNPGKLAHLKPFFEGTGCELRNCDIEIDVEENGADPAANALIKAEYCAEKTGLPSVAEDSGLYFVELPMDDPRQPGLFVRRVGGKELTYEEMVGHYRSIAREFGGRVLAAWYDGYAISFGKGKNTCFLMPEEDRMVWAFWLLDEQKEPISPGMPIDCISEWLPRTPEREKLENDYREKLTRYFYEAIRQYKEQKWN